MKLVGSVITYYPDVSDTIKNILQYIEYVDLLIIWENTPECDQQKYKINLPNYESKIIFQTTGKNEGIAYALNSLVAYSIENGYTHLLSMDQDSFFVDFKKYKEYVEEYTYRDNFGIFAPNANSTLKSDNHFEIVYEAITSGSIYNLKIFELGLSFREDFFIDMVDNEFCYQAYKKNILTIAFPKCILKQQFGNITRYLGLYSLNYSAFRIYHIIRNFIVTWKEYPDLIQNKTKIINKLVINRVIKIILLEKDKKQKLLAVYWGIRDGLSKKMIDRVF